MSFIDRFLLDLTERFCRRFQRLTGRTNVWIAVQLTNLSIVVYFVWAGAYVFGTHLLLEAVRLARRSRAALSCAESAAVIGGPSGFQIGSDGRESTQAPLRRGLYTARLSGVERSARTTGPATVLPPVPTVHAQLCPVTARVNGAVILKAAGPRSQVTPKEYSSSRAVRP